MLRFSLHRLALPTLLFTGVAFAADPPPMDPWQAASSFMVREAYDSFAGDNEKSLERDFGTGITLLNLQPRTQGNLNRAQNLFEEIAAKTPPDSPLHALSRFFRARILEFYLAEPDPAAAEKEYLAVLELRTGNPVVELAASRLVTMAAFADAPREEILARLAELGRLKELLQSPQGLREFHTTMGYALLDNQGDDHLVVDHFLAADAIGFTRMSNAARVWIIGGDTAAKIGRLQDAAYFYRNMIDRMPRDGRTFSVRQRLRALESNDNG